MNKERLVKTFIELASIPSPSLYEGELRDYIIKTLEPYDLIVKQDNTSNTLEGESNNLIVDLKSDKDDKYILFDAHMDTVGPCEKINVIHKDGVIKTDGTSVLGSDDKAGIAIMLEAIHSIMENNKPFRSTRFVFSVAEEVGLLGAKNLDEKYLKDVDIAYVLDGEGDPGIITTQTPYGWKGQLKIIGKEAHAGLEPEKGINALKVASLAIADLPVGRINENSTFNIGKISGGVATNVVMGSTILDMESRSYNLEELELIVTSIKNKFEDVALNEGAELEWNARFGTPGYKIGDTDKALVHFEKACQNKEIAIKKESCGGGSNANIYRMKNIDAVAISVGMRNIHSVEEYILEEDLVKVAEIVQEIIYLID